MLHNRPQGTAPVISKDIAEKWRGMTVADKQKYVERARDERLKSEALWGVPSSSLQDQHERHNRQGIHHGRQEQLHQHPVQTQTQMQMQMQAQTHDVDRENGDVSSGSSRAHSPTHPHPLWPPPFVTQQEHNNNTPSTYVPSSLFHMHSMPTQLSGPFKDPFLMRTGPSNPITPRVEPLPQIDDSHEIREQNYIELPNPSISSASSSLVANTPFDVPPLARRQHFTVRVRMQGDNYYREVRLFDFTWNELRLRIAHKLRLSEAEARRMLIVKSPSVLIADNEDVQLLDPFTNLEIVTAMDDPPVHRHTNVLQDPLAVDNIVNRDPPTGRQHPNSHVR
eukprot:GILJ01004887.1.p1 GENE.GILJ01004887.1~~GILJ01004887.1.p1  ORF type:complete len:337 (-),score=45.98 GILJ01004887.1:171-1181(-)